MNKCYKNVFLLLVILSTGLLLPKWVLAKDVNVLIKGIEVYDAVGDAEELSEATIDGSSLNLDLSFRDVNDSITYKLVMENKDDEDYTLEIENDDEYVIYEIENNIINKNSDTAILLTVKYKTEIPIEEIGQSITKTAKISIIDEDGEEKGQIVINPITKDIIKYSILLFLLSIIILIILLIIINRKAKIITLLLVAAILAIVNVYALRTLEITINTTYEISSGYFYAMNLYNYESSLMIDSDLPDDVTLYKTPELAMDRWKPVVYDDLPRPFYFKHKLNKDNLIEESYLGFVITEELAQEYPGMVAGTYYLRGGGSNCGSYYNCNNPSPYYEDNINIIKQAFGYDEHPDRCYEYAGGISCYAYESGLGVGADSAGRLFADMYPGNRSYYDDWGYYKCEIYNSSSICSGDYYYH